MKNRKIPDKKLRPCQSKREKEYRQLIKLSENAGIMDLMKLYGEYKKLLDTANKFLQQMNQKFVFSTKDSST